MAAVKKINWVHSVIQIVAGGFCLYWYFRLYRYATTPSPGKALLVLAGMSVLMLLSEMGLYNKILYVVLVFSLMWIENQAIDKDRAAYASSQATALREQNDRFSRIQSDQNNDFITLFSMLQSEASLPQQVNEAVQREAAANRDLAEIKERVGSINGRYELKVKATKLSADMLRLLAERQEKAPPFPADPRPVNDPETKAAMDYTQATLGLVLNKYNGQIDEVHDGFKKYGLDTTFMEKVRRPSFAFMQPLAREIGKLASML